MKTYNINVNGNIYSVTLKSISGDTAYVDVDGLEYEVGIDGDGIPSTPSAASATSTAAKAPKKRRSSALAGGESSGGAAAQPSGSGVVLAHLPGLILDILVSVGDTVKSGDVVCKMEAMKMENDVRCGVDGKVVEILVEVQQNVLENAALMVIE